MAHALNTEFCDNTHHSPEMIIHKAEELVQEVNRLRTKSTNVETHLTSVEVDYRSCKDSLDRVNSEKEQLQRQVSTQLVDLDRLRQVRQENEIFKFIFCVTGYIFLSFIFSA